MRVHVKKALLLFSLCMCIGIVLGLHRAAGIFFIYFQDDFDATATQISFVIVLPIAFLFIGGPIYAIVFRGLGVLKTIIVSTAILFIAYLGISLARVYTVLLLSHAVMGIGYGFCHITVYTTAGTVFKRERALANNTLYSSTIIFGIFAPPVVQGLITTYTWRGILFILAAVTLNQIPFGYLADILYKDITELTMISQLSVTNKDDLEEKPPVKPTNEIRVTCDPIFYIFCISCVGMYTFQIVTMQYLVRYAQDIGISNESAAAMLSGYFIANLCTSITTGVLSTLDNKKSSLKHFTTVNFMIFLCVMESFVLMIPIAFQTHQAYLVYMILFGILSGGVGAFPISLIAQLFGVAQLPLALGMRSLTAGIFTLSIPPFVGFLVDVFGNYKPVQYVSAVMVLTGACLLYFVEIRIKKRNAR